MNFDELFNEALKFGTSPKRSGGMQKKTLARIEAINKQFQIFGAMTIRQIYYRLLGGPHSINYKQVSHICTIAREAGKMSYGNIVDRSRPIYGKTLHGSLLNFLDGAPYDFNLDYWKDSPVRPVIWTEKDALSQVLYGVAREYNVDVYVTRGFLSASNKHRWDGDVVLYFGDFDPSGLCISEDLERFGNSSDFRRVSLTLGQVQEHDLPPIPVSRNDTRTPGYRSKYGDYGYELDSLPPDVLKRLVRESIEEFMDFDLEEKQAEESRIVQDLEEIIAKYTDDLIEEATKDDGW